MIQENKKLEQTYDIQNLTQCQIEQVENLIKNLNHIKIENYFFFPEDLIIERNENQYQFKFEELNESFVIKTNQKAFQENEHKKPIYYSKHILMLLTKLSELNIYLPTLRESSFIFVDKEKEVSRKQDQQSTQQQQCVLYKFSLEKLDKHQKEIQSNCSLSPELVNLLSTDVNNIVFTEKMAIFNIGCLLFELFTSQQLYSRESSFQEGNQDVTKHLFKSLKYKNYLLGQLVQKCTIENETELNRRFTFKEALAYIQHIDKCVDYIKIANQQEVSIKIEDFFSQNSSLHDNLVESLKLKANHQLTGRLYILQNLITIKFIYILFQREDLECFRDFLIMKLLLVQVQELEQLQNKKINQNQFLNFNDSLDEIYEFQTHYSSKYLLLLFQLIKGIEENQYNKKSKKHFKSSFKLSTVMDFQKNFHVDQFKLDTPKQQLHNLCLQNINSVFLKDRLIQNFNPIFTQLQLSNPHQIYDTLLSILFGNEIKDNTIQEIIKTIKSNQN